MDEVRNRIVEIRFGRIVFVLSLLFFAISSTPYPVHNESLSYLIQHLHLQPFWPMTSPVWGWLLRAIDALGIRPASLVPNVISVLSGAASASLLYTLVVSLRFGPRLEKAFPLCRVFAGILAALFLVTSIPFWIVSNRAHPASFGVLILLSACWLYRRYKATLAPKHAFLLTAALSIGGLEFGPTAIIAPALLFGLFIAASAKRRVTPQLWFAVGAGLVLGPALLLLAAWQYSKAPVSDWREFKSYGQVLHYFLIEAYGALRGGMVKQGWLILILTTIVPWIAVLMMSRQAHSNSHRPPGWGNTFLNIVLTAISFLILLDGPLSPWRLMEDAGRLLVIPHLVAAVTFGYMLSYWTCTICHRVARGTQVQTSRPATVIASALAVTFVVVAFLHADRVSTAPSRALREISRLMLSGIADRNIVITEGLMENSLLLQAHDERRDVQFINMQLAGNPVYRRYVASTLDDPRLQNMARVGILPLINEWLKPGNDVASRIAFQSTPDFWLAANRPVLPHKCVYLGVIPMSAPAPEQLVADHVDFWRTIQPPLLELGEQGDALRVIGRIVSTHISSVANDLGVYLENARRPDLARAAYGHALDLMPENLSSLVNLHTLLVEQGASNEAAAVWLKIEQQKRNVPEPAPLRAIAGAYGHIRDRQSIAALEDVIATAGPQDGPDPRLVPAIEKLRSGDYAAARTAAEDVVRTSPDFETGWILLSMVMYMQKDDEGLLRVEDRMRNMGKEWPQIIFLQARRALAKGDRKAARPLLEKSLALWPGNPAIYEVIVQLDLDQGDYKIAESRVRTLLAMDPGNTIGNFALGSILYREGKNDQAEEAFRKSLERGRFMPSMNNLAWILVDRGAEEEALQLAGEAIVIDATSSDAWDTLGVVHMKMRQFEDAEKALRKASELAPQSNDPLIHLIELDVRRGNLAQAHDAARALRQERKLSPPENDRLSKALRGD